jgi:glutathione S-transferase
LCSPTTTQHGVPLTTAEDKIRLYELVLDNGCPVSPYVWRIRYALAHKGLSCETVPLGFTEISRSFTGRFKTVPVLEHGDSMLAESWDIAEHLDRAFPGRPALFSGPAEQAMVRLTDAWLSADILRKMFFVYVLDIHNAARPEDRAYFRRTREEWLKGKTLEEATADRASRLPALRDALTPLRAHLSRFPYLGGGVPNYADYIALGLFLWVASVSTLPMLAHDDTLRSWVNRGFELYGGLGRDPRMHALFE